MSGADLEPRIPNAGSRIPDPGSRIPDPDTDARDLITAALDETLVVEAAAGTGKTTALVDRIVRIIETGRADVREIVAVTFTEKAAGELKLRLRERLEARRQAAADPAIAARLDAAVQHLEEAHVSTIHGFCADLLRERPVEARVDPLFGTLTEHQAERLFEEAFDRWLQNQLESPPEGIRRSLRRSSRSTATGEHDGPTVRLRRAAYELAQWRDFVTPWTREPFDREAASAEVVALVHTVADLSAAPASASDTLYLDTAPVRRLSAQLRVDGDADLDALEARLVDLAGDRDFRRMRRGSGASYGRGVVRARVQEARDGLAFALADFQRRADADLAALLQQELRACVAEYERLKAREGALDFLDLLLRARALVSGNTDVRAHFQRRFTRLFIDEFQDTDPLQADLLLLLAADDPDEGDPARVRPAPGKLFIVGDPKQSIYRFRRADVDVYRRVCEQLVGAGGRRVPLQRSFRSVPNIQRLVNAAFAPVMDGDRESRQAAYMPLEPVREDVDQPSVVALPVPRPYGWRGVTAWEIERSLPDAVGAYVAWLVRDSGWTVTERRDASVRVPVQPRHVCILFRRFVSFGRDVTRPYVDALEARGVRHLLVGGRAFHEREEIETLRAALRAIEWPDDQLSVFATLRGALFAIGDEVLIEYHHLHRRFHPFRVPDGDALAPRFGPVRDALETLGALHRQRNRRPVADTIAALLDATRAHVGFVLRPNGEQVLANVLHVSELARQYELEGGMSFRGFVERLQAEADAGSAAEAPILEEGSDGVRLMTVHKAKGLEYPVVILADITARLTPWDASRHLDADRRLCAVRLGGWAPADLNAHRDLELLRERREGERIAYVAATRARDLLVVPAVGDGPFDEGWIAPLNGALYPEGEARRQAGAHPACPTFTSRDTVLERPDGSPASSQTVSPGWHRIGRPGEQHDVVWWSPEPAVLALGGQAPLGLRRDDLIVKDVAPTVLRRQLDRYTAWRQGRDAAVAGASRPSLRIVTATEAAADERYEPASPFAVEAVHLDAGVARPSGTRFGSLVHALLADVPLDGPASLADLATAYGRVFGAPPVEVTAAQQLVGRALAHPLLRDAARAAAAGECRRETPVTFMAGDGALIEGTIDLAYRTSAGIVVIDFKTDEPAGDLLARYQRQLALYASALAHATHLDVRPILMLL